MILEITHTTSSSTPTFTNPLEIRFSGSFGYDTTVRVDINSNLEQYVFTDMGNVNNLANIDPNNWIINEVGTIVKDLTLTTSIDDLTTIADYVISPNPSNGNYLIETEMTGSHVYRIYDTRGRLVQEGNFSSSKQIDLTSEMNGNYIMQLTAENGDARVKILVKN